MVALVVGATGLVGRMVTEELLGREELEEVRVLVRSLPDITHPQLKPILVEWDQLDRYSEAFSGVHSVYCAWEPRSGKQGPSKEVP